MVVQIGGVLEIDTAELVEYLNAAQGQPDVEVEDLTEAAG